MTEKELLKKHLLTDDKEFVAQYEANPPQIIKDLQWQAGEGIISELDPKDWVQLLSRYLNNDGVYVKNILHFLLRCERLLTWIAEANGVNVDAKFKQDAKEKLEKQEELNKLIKEQLKNSVKQ